MMARHRQKRPSRKHLLRALRCTCDPVGAEKGCSVIGCEKCRVWGGVKIYGEETWATCWRDPRLSRGFSASGGTP